jgi:hypothetical protein
MKNRFIQWWKSCNKTIESHDDPKMERSVAGRILNALTIIIVIVCLGLWITAFLLLKDRFFAKTLSENLLTDLTCITFFGGLVIAILTGALASNFLHRVFWKMLIRRG